MERSVKLPNNKRDQNQSSLVYQNKISYSDTLVN